MKKASAAFFELFTTTPQADMQLQEEPMARQPFRLPKDVDTPWGIGGPYNEQSGNLNDKLAQWIGRIAANWSFADLQMSLLLGAFLGVENAASVAVYQSFRINSDKRRALEAAANIRITRPDIRQGFDALLAVHKRLDQQRNDVVHGVWGASPAAPDGIIWARPQDHANFLIETYNFEKSGGDWSNRNQAHEATKDCFTYRYSDLEQLNREIDGLVYATGSFHSFIRYEQDVQGPPAWDLFTKIPVIDAELRK